MERWGVEKKKKKIYWPWLLASALVSRPPAATATLVRPRAALGHRLRRPRRPPQRPPPPPRSASAARRPPAPRRRESGPKRSRGSRAELRTGSHPDRRRRRRDPTQRPRARRPSASPPAYARTRGRGGARRPLTETALTAEERAAPPAAIGPRVLSTPRPPAARPEPAVATLGVGHVSSRRGGLQAIRRRGRSRATPRDGRRSSARGREACRKEKWGCGAGAARRAAVTKGREVSPRG